MRSNYKKIGAYVRQVSTKNSDLKVADLKGISINKEFMPSVANTNGTDLSKYRVVSKHQFAFNPMHVGRDEALPIAQLLSDEPVIVSPAYVVFEIIDKEQLDPEYLMMWCRRSEFDRNAWFTTDNSVRGGFSWHDFCEMALPVPTIENQREIVREYNTIVERIKFNEQLSQKLEETAQALYKQLFIDFEVPISTAHARPIEQQDVWYRNIEGRLLYNDKLDIDIPESWGVGSLDELADPIDGDRGKNYPSKEDLKSNGFCLFLNTGNVTKSQRFPLRTLKLDSTDCPIWHLFRP